MPQTVFNPFAVGDLKPIAIIIRPDDLNGHTPGTVVSGSWALVLSDNSVIAGVSPVTGSLTVDARAGPSFITTAPISWGTAGTYICRFELTWNDGEVDNTLSARITVNPLSTM